MTYRERTVAVWLRPDDVDALQQWAERQCDSTPGPARWVWWRIRQACQEALSQEGGAKGAHGGVDRAAH